jgi:hypothetical protein
MFQLLCSSIAVVSLINLPLRRKAIRPCAGIRIGRFSGRRFDEHAPKLKTKL